MKKLEHQLEQYRMVLTYLVGDISKLNYTFHCGFPRFRKIADRLNEAWQPFSDEVVIIPPGGENESGIAS